MGQDYEKREYLKRESQVSDKLFTIFNLLANTTKLNYIRNNEVVISTSDNRDIFKISNSKLNISNMSLPKNFLTKPSILPDQFAPNQQIESLFRYLSDKNLLSGLNHLGLCYIVDSKINEANRIKAEIVNTNLHLYQEESLDLSAWLFIGDTNIWQDPLFEFVPTEKNNDKWKDYWLPHFQIDIDTSLSGEELELLITKIFNGKIYPYRLIVVNDYICVVRARLGIVSGINIELDLGTSGRGVQHHREKLLTRIV